ncbi:Pectinacetylesterase [Lachnospiraceae bacterium KH1T2]|nr:Pectinacetylesterase [Lachnospiraceae bacterium KH1T2]
MPKAIETIGNLVDNTISRGIEKYYEAPFLEGEPEEKVWYKILLPDGLTGDGTEYYIYIKKGKLNNLCIFFSGGGVAWNEYTAARPTTGGAMAAGLPNYYWDNLRPITQLMNINVGITENNTEKNPFDEWNFLIVTYATGDFHVGNNEFYYKDENEYEKILNFHGFKNFQAAMEKGTEFFKSPEKLLIAGESAGAFAVPALTRYILRDYYSECSDITLLSDSALMLYKGWKNTAKNVWKASDELYSTLHSYNICADWYESLYAEFGDRLKYLYAGSPRDYLLSAYYNDVLTHTYKSTTAIQEHYFMRFKQMLKRLKKINPNFGFFIYKWMSLQMPFGGTEHTSVRHRSFYMHTSCGLSMAEWLNDAVNGNVYDANLDYVK